MTSPGDSPGDLCADAMVSVDEYATAVGKSIPDDEDTSGLERDICAVSDYLRRRLGTVADPIPSAIKRLCIDLVAIWRLESPRATNRIAEGIDSFSSTSVAASQLLERVVAAYADDAWFS